MCDHGVIEPVRERMPNRRGTPATRAKGMTEAQRGELLAMIGMASTTNAQVTGRGVEVHEVFKA